MVAPSVEGRVTGVTQYGDPNGDPIGPQLGAPAPAAPAVPAAASPAPSPVAPTVSGRITAVQPPPPPLSMAIDVQGERPRTGASGSWDAPAPSQTLAPSGTSVLAGLAPARTPAPDYAPRPGGRSFTGAGASGQWSEPGPPPPPPSAPVKASVVSASMPYNYPPSVRFAEESSRDLADLDPRIQQIFHTIDSQFSEMNPGYKVIVSSGTRTREHQESIPRKYTTADGTKNVSRHQYQPALAVDLNVVDARTGRFVDPRTPDGYKLYLSFGEMAEKAGYVWGGRWIDPWDPYHIQLEEPAPFSPDAPMDTAVSKFTRLQRGALN